MNPVNWYTLFPYLIPHFSSQFFFYYISFYNMSVISLCIFVFYISYIFFFSAFPFLSSNPALSSSCFNECLLYYISFLSLSLFYFLRHTFNHISFSTSSVTFLSSLYCTSTLAFNHSLFLSSETFFRYSLFSPSRSFFIGVQ